MTDVEERRERILKMERVELEGALDDALKVIDAYGDAEGYWPRAASEPAKRLREKGLIDD